jgi:hypothetical protein
MGKFASKRPPAIGTFAVTPDIGIRLLTRPLGQPREATMSTSALFLNSSEAASRLGVSVKALQLYEQRGLITPVRTEVGYRAYGPDEMSCAAEIVSLRASAVNAGEILQRLAGAKVQH